MGNESAEHQLLVFVGYADDARAVAEAIRDNQPEFQAKLDLALKHREHRLKQVKIWTWNDDLGSEPGGQVRIDPKIENAHCAVFAFVHRVGAVTERELQLARAQGERVRPVYPAFPKKADADLIAEEEGALEWARLLQFRKSLTADWTEDESRSLRPIDRYESIDHLVDILVERFEHDLPGMRPTQRHRAHPRRIHPAPPCSAPATSTP